MELDRRKARFVLHELGPGESPRDALKWVERELLAIDRLISEALEKSPKNNSD